MPLNLLNYVCTTIGQKRKMITLHSCKNNKRDARIAFSWRNDPKTVAASYIARPKSWDSFWLEYSEGYFQDSRFAPVFIIESGEPAGFIRFEKAALPDYPDQTIIEVMINVAPYRRGEGVGTEALLAVCRHMKEKGVFALLADIRKTNKASRAAFEKAGFVLRGERTEYIAKTKENCCILCYLCKL